MGEGARLVCRAVDEGFLQSTVAQYKGVEAAQQHLTNSSISSQGPPAPSAVAGTQSEP